MILERADHPDQHAKGGDQGLVIAQAIRCFGGMDDLDRLPSIREGASSSLHFTDQPFDAVLAGAVLEGHPKQQGLRLLTPASFGDLGRTRFVPSLGQVAAAGGVSVVAHPWGRRYTHQALDEARFAALKDEGLAGIEVDHQDHEERDRETLRAIARNLDLVVTGSSDYHGDGKVDHDLGCNTTDPEDFARLVDLARASAAASGRTTPEVLFP